MGAHYTPNSAQIHLPEFCLLYAEARNAIAPKITRYQIGWRLWLRCQKEGTLLAKSEH